ncbi:MAG: DegT/DnrJ/EryC1/StrS family aminotransferase, partial [Nocardioidaceae bacterium]
DAIWELARENGLAVVEDAAHAFPASYHDRPVGTMPGSVTGTSCFSFYATKTLTTGEGGMLTTEDATLADRARSMSLHGLSRQAWTRYAEGGSWAYDIVAPGFKYNLTDVAAAMGLVQLSRAEEMRERRAQIAAAYTAAFAPLAGLECPTVPPGVDTAWHLYLLRLGDASTAPWRDDFVAALGARGVGTSVHFIPLHLHSYYAREYGFRPADFPVATAQFRRACSLPIYSAMSDADVQRVIDVVSESVQENP